MDEQKIRKIENFHIFLWLIKDLCWVSLSKTMGVIMIIPTIGLAVYITYINRSEKTELAHNLAVCCWIIANSIWMFGEFYLEDSTRKFSMIFFIIGIGIITMYYGKLLLKKIQRPA